VLTADWPWCPAAYNGQLDGVDQRSNPLLARKGLLKKLLAKPEVGIQLNEHLTGNRAVIFSHACRLGQPGGNITG
jgi:hypothetical protein